MPDSDGAPFILDATISPRIWAEVHIERMRAHAKHGANSIEQAGRTDPRWLAVIVEEVGEAAAEWNEYRRTAHSDEDGAEIRARLRAELIQVAAMAGSWADALTESPS